MRQVLGLFSVLAFGAPGLAQSVNLTEKRSLGDPANYSISLDLKGNLVVALENGKQPIPLEATAKHRLTERTLELTSALPSTSARYYAEATATALVGADRFVRSLPADRRVIVARRGLDGCSCFSPAGPLTRDELELVTDHFNPQCLPGLLPGKPVDVNESWPLTDAAAQAACSFDVLLKANLTGKLTSVKDGIAAFAVEGTAEGMENGSKATVTVTATGKFDVAAGHIASLSWMQKDTREQGPASPASQVEARINLTREAAAPTPKEIADEALAGLPGEVPQSMLALRYSDPRGRYRVTHARDWHLTGQTDAHLVLRLVERGEFIAQATVTAWSKVEPGKHTGAAEFQKAAAAAPGWTPGKVLFDQDLPAMGGRWVHRLVVDGKMDDVPVVQTFYFLAGPQGDQVVVTLASRPERFKSVGSRDLDLVNGIEFGQK